MVRELFALGSAMVTACFHKKRVQVESEEGEMAEAEDDYDDSYDETDLCQPAGWADWDD